MVCGGSFPDNATSASSHAVGDAHQDDPHESTRANAASALSVRVAVAEFLCPRAFWMYMHI